MFPVGIAARATPPALMIVNPCPRAKGRVMTRFGLGNEVMLPRTLPRPCIASPSPMASP